MDNTRKRVALVSLGCAKNLVDSEVMLGYLKNSGYTLHTDLTRADIAILNTCGFIRPAREEAEDHIRKMLELKAENPLLKIVVAGCYVQNHREDLSRRFPEVDVWTGVNDFHHIVQLIENRPFERSDRCFLYDHDSPRQLSTPPAWAYLKISEGCSHRCGFCTIPRIKGPYRSRGIQDILNEAARLAGQGIREVNLISQDSTFYGRDLGMREGLPALLEQLRETSGLKWIRVLYAYPEEITDRLLDVMRSPGICPYVDSPFQHADPSMIRAMKRGMDGSRALKLISKMRQRVPQVALRTSLIVGFPGEGPEEFRRLKEFVEAAEFDHLGVFTYSHEKYTDSSRLDDDVPQQLKEERRREIMEIQARISRRNLKKYVGRRLPVLAEGFGDDRRSVVLGRTQFQAPEVDGMVFIDSPPGSDLRETLVEVEIQRSEVYDLYGTQVKCAP